MTYNVHLVRELERIATQLEGAEAAAMAAAERRGLPADLRCAFLHGWVHGTCLHAALDLRSVIDTYLARRR